MPDHFAVFRHVFFTLIYLFLVASCNVSAQDLKDLAADPTWLKLVHYETDHLSKSGWRSAIHSSDFFLAVNGKTDPYGELLATIAALRVSRSAPQESDTHAQCRFPARKQWLQSKMGEQLTLAPSVSCTELNDWTQSNSVSSISVVLATGYLGNPASYYGHTLLKFNFKGDQHTRLMDASVNYGAIDSTRDDPLSYIAKGIFGGYDGGFSHAQYYFHDHNYGENELRDLWEYELDLPQEVVNLIVNHAWEVLGKRYTYYFFRRNCAFRMAEILQVAEGVNILPGMRPWTIPQSVIDKLGQADYDNRSLLGVVNYWPSRQSRLYEKYQNLSVEQSRIMKDIVNGRERLNGATFFELDLGSQQVVLDALLDYYQFIRDVKAGDADSANESYRQALAMRYQLPPGTPKIGERKVSSPHLGRPPSWLQLGRIHNSARGGALMLRIRPAYYDALDSDSGHVGNSALSMGDIGLLNENGKWRLRHLDVIAIASISPGLTGLPGDRGRGWNLKLGAEPLRLDCRGCTVARFQGDIGYGWPLSQRVFGAVYVGGAVQEKRHGHGFGYGKASTRIIFKPNQNWGVKVDYEYRHSVGGQENGFSVWDMQARRSLGKNSDLRLSYQKNGAEELTLGIGFYW